MSENNEPNTKAITKDEKNPLKLHHQKETTNLTL